MQGSIYRLVFALESTDLHKSIVDRNDIDLACILELVAVGVAGDVTSGARGAFDMCLVRVHVIAGLPASKSNQSPMDAIRKTCTH